MWDVATLKADENCESKLLSVYIVYFPRGLRTHRYQCVAMKGFFSGRTMFSSFNDNPGVSLQLAFRLINKA
ncbi:hypothetical protein [Candidatus Cloacimonas acidaminovorans]|uniref:hypothetical protein n=1 Tax=Candidatus Cloacimonas acidaminovorans TaxID=456827 RepID=UPI0012FF35FD|nr:hypothetical protein [Candidatus Cloacimonas acidaminovorans]